MTMEEQLISFDTAKLAKEKGFDEVTNHYYDLEDDNQLDHNSFNWTNSQDFPIVSAPTQSLLQKWLREEHEIYVYITPTPMGGKMGFKWNIYFPVQQGVKYKSYEKALEAGLLEALKLIS